MTIRKVNFSVFYELDPLFRFVMENRGPAKRQCATCRKRPPKLFLQDADLPDVVTVSTLDAFRHEGHCWECAVTITMVAKRLEVAS